MDQRTTTLSLEHDPVADAVVARWHDPPAPMAPLGPDELRELALALLEAASAMGPLPGIAPVPDAGHTSPAADDVH